MIVVKYRKLTPESVAIYTSDVPPIPISQTDVLKISFSLHNVQVNGKTAAVEIASAHVKGAMIDTKNVKETHNFIAVNTPNAEWHFLRQKQASAWLLYFVSVRVEASKLATFVRLT